MAAVRLSIGGGAVGDARLGLGSVGGLERLWYGPNGLWVSTSMRPSRSGMTSTQLKAASSTEATPAWRSSRESGAVR